MNAAVVLPWSDLQPAAFLSPCEVYRYWLTRRDPVWLGRPPLVVCMLNPSTANALVDDQTIRKLYGFASMLGRSGLVVVNAYAFRARDPRAMKRAPDPVGPLNDAVLETVARLVRATMHRPEVVVAWGKHCEPARARAVAAIFERQSVARVSFGRNLDGSPRHPLMLPYSTPLAPWCPA